MLPLLLACTSSSLDTQQQHHDTSDGDRPAHDSSSPDSPAQDTAPAHPCDSGEFAVTLGTGEAGYEELADGQQLTMIHGPQGGWHLLGGFEVYNADYVLDFQITGYLEDQTLICDSYAARVAALKLDSCRSQYYGVYCYLEIPEELREGECDTPPELLTGSDIELRISITDVTSKQSAQDQRSIRAAADPQDRTDCHDESADGEEQDTGGG